MTWTLETSNGNEAAKIRNELVPYTAGATLDIGCGPWRAFRHFIGIDEQAQPGVTLAMRGENLRQFATEEWDAVFSSHFLEHVVDFKAALAEWWRVIKVGGHLCLYLPHKDHYPQIGQPGSNPDHKHDFAPDDIVHAMAEVARRSVRGWDLMEYQIRAGSNEYSFFLVFRKLADKRTVFDGGKRVVDEQRALDAGKSAAIVRPGAYGDSLWASSIAAHLKDEGYRVTVYTGPQGEEVLRADPNIDRIIAIHDHQFSLQELPGYWDAESAKYNRFINLAEAVEKNNLAIHTDLRFYWPAEVRRQVFGGSYFDRIHDLAGVGHKLRMRFIPTPDERTAAQKRIRGLRVNGRRLVALAVSGSTPPKFYPHLDALLAALVEAKCDVIILGDTRGWQPAIEGPLHGRVRNIGQDWPIREALAFTQLCDIVIGQETALLNAVAIEPMRKVVLLSHSSRQNLTDRWHNTVALSGNVPCYPCHQLHQTFRHCPRDEATGAAACQADIRVQHIVAAALEPLKYRTAA